MYIGQAYGPFLLSCHMDPKYDANPRSTELLQCAGAAGLRANVGLTERMPKALLEADPGLEGAFSSPEEMLMHHGEMTEEEAKAYLSRNPPEKLLDRELKKQGCEQVEIKRDR